MNPTDRIFVPLDTPDLDKGLALARALVGLIGGLKIGKEFFTALGPAGVEHVPSRLATGVQRGGSSRAECVVVVNEGE